MSNPNYPIHFENNDLEQLQLWLNHQTYSQILVLVDSNTAQFCLPILEQALAKWELSIIRIEAGEVHKNINTCQLIWADMLRYKTDRQALLLNLGGGVIGDMGGFCASTYKRGIDFVQLPTTLLAQVDASVGGKLGVDFEGIKNGIGLFCNPKAVFMNATFFQTLPAEQIKSGYAEILKHALIADSNYWQYLMTIKDLKNINWQTIVQQSLPIKQTIVAADPLEKGLRKSLNFGHTIGHAIESLSWESSSPLLHGYTVALGIVIESYWSYKILGFPKEHLNQISRYILTIYPKYNLQKLNLDKIKKLVWQDKKNTYQQINCTLLQQLGKTKINQAISNNLIAEGLDYYQNL